MSKVRKSLSDSKESAPFGYEEFIKLQSEYHSDFVPRSRRFSSPLRVKPLSSFVENVVNTKINNNGVDHIVTRVISVPASEHYSKFNCNDFRISTLLETGVKLSLCSIQVQPIQEIQRIVDHLNVVRDNEIYLNQHLKDNLSTVDPSPETSSESLSKS